MGLAAVGRCAPLGCSVLDMAVGVYCSTSPGIGLLARESASAPAVLCSCEQELGLGPFCLAFISVGARRSNLDRPSCIGDVGFLKLADRFPGQSKQCRDELLVGGDLI